MIGLALSPKVMNRIFAYDSNNVISVHFGSVPMLLHTCLPWSLNPLWRKP